MSILIIEKSKSDQEQLTFLLHLGGHFDLVFAESIAEAYQQLGIGDDNVTNCQFNLIIMDLFIAGLDGIAICKRIKSERYLVDIPIIVVTRHEGIEYMLQVFEAGALDYVTKPLSNKIELLPRVNSALQLKQEMETRKAREKELLEMTKLLRESNHKLQHANEKLEEIASRDPLTQIANRRYFYEVYDKEFKRSIRNALPISIIMLDIDYFKFYNDYYGHQRGDDCLKRFSGALQDSLNRPCDLVARYGGEEFIILLTETDTDGAVQVVEKIQEQIEDLKIPHPESKVSHQVTASIGIATVVPDKAITSEEVIAWADKALYQAKTDGRNQFAVYEK